MAFRLCRDIGCPHPSQLGRFGIGFEELTDWHAFYLWENSTNDNEADDQDKVDTLRHLRNEWDEPRDTAT